MLWLGATIVLLGGANAMTGTNFNAFTLSGATLLLALTLAPAVAQETEFNIEAQPLAKALLEFNEQSGLTVAARRDLVADKTAPAVHGEMEPEVALGRILFGTGLKLTQLSSGGYTITVDAADLGKYRSGRSPVPMVRNQIVAAQSQTAASRSEATRSGRSDERGVGIVTGKVTDERTGANLKGAKVTIEETGQWTSTNDLGEFRFVNVPTGSATLTVSYLGYAGQSAVVGVRGDGTSQNFALRGGSEIEEIVVFGQRSARALALNQERTADNVSTILSADTLGRYPGTTISESLRRAPGVAFQRDAFTGDGTNIILRGLEPDLNAVKLNGIELTSGTGLGRSPNLGNILTDSISQITISKSLLASQDSAGTGGLVEIETKSPLDRPRRFASFLAETGQRGTDFNEETTLGATLSARFGGEDQLGVSVSAQTRSRDNKRVAFSGGLLAFPYYPLQIDGTPTVTSSLQIDPRRRLPWEPEANAGYLLSVEDNLDVINTENRSFTLSAAWEPTSTLSLRFDYQRSDAESDIYNRTQEIGSFPGRTLAPVPALGGDSRQILDWSQFEFIGFTSSATVSEGAEEDTEVFTLNGNAKLGAWTVDGTVGRTEAATFSPQFSADFVSQSFFFSGGPLVSTDAIDPITGVIVSPFGRRTGDSYPLPLLTEEGFATFNSEGDRQFLFGFDTFASGRSERDLFEIKGKREFASNFVSFLELGALFEESTFASGFGDQFRYFPIPDENGQLPALASLGIRLSEDSLADIGVTGGFRTFRAEDIGRFLLSELDNMSVPFENAGRGQIGRQISTQHPNQDREETVEREISGFVQAKLQYGNLEFIPGIRVTRFDIDAILDTSPALFLGNGQPDLQFAEENRRLERESATQTTVLPRILANYRINDELLVRFGYFQSIARPQIGNLALSPSISLSLGPNFGPNGDLPRLSVRKGNPDLKPAKTHNLDISFEHYNRQIGALKLGAFYKRIDNLLESNVTSGVGALGDAASLLPDDDRFQDVLANPGDYFISVSIPQNNPDSAEIWGIETVFERQFNSLPSYFGGLGILANYTYTDSSKQQPVSWDFSPILDNNGNPVLDENGNVAVESVELIIDDVRFNNQPKHSGTLALTYNWGGLDASIAYTSQSRFQKAYADFGLSMFEERYSSLDLFAEFTLELGSATIGLFVEGIDLLRNEKDPNIRTTEGGVGSVPKYHTGAVYFGGRQLRAGVNAIFN